MRWPAGNEITRIKQVLGVQLDAQLLPIEEFTPYISIKGFIGLPQFALKNRKDQYLFINKRFVRYPYLHHAILQAYESLIPETDNKILSEIFKYCCIVLRIPIKMLIVPITIGAYT